MGDRRPRCAVLRALDVDIAIQYMYMYVRSLARQPPL